VHAIEAGRASQFPRITGDDQRQLSRNDAASVGGIFTSHLVSLVGLLRPPPASDVAPLLADERTPSVPDQTGLISARSNSCAISG
jgi:hypothetical protein